MYSQSSGNNEISSSELMGSLKLGNVWVFVQLIHRPTRTKHQLYKNPNIALPNLRLPIVSGHQEYYMFSSFQIFSAKEF